MDGTVMGGGVGISLAARLPHRHRAHALGHARDRDRSLPGRRRAAGSCRGCTARTGLWLALTGARLGAADCELLGLATDVVVRAADLPAIKAAIAADPDAIETILAELEADPRPRRRSPPIATTSTGCSPATAWRRSSTP